MIVPEIGNHLPHGVVTPAEALRRAGYATGYFGKWHLGGAPDQHPTRHGFDEAIVTRGRHFAPRFRTFPKTPVDPDKPLAEFLTDQTLAFVDGHKSGPFFVVLSHFAVHIPLGSANNRLETILGETKEDEHG